MNKHGRQVVERFSQWFLYLIRTVIYSVNRDERMQMEQHKSENKARCRLFAKRIVRNLELLQTLPGIKEESAANIIAEIRWIRRCSNRIRNCRLGRPLNRNDQVQEKLNPEKSPMGINTFVKYWWRLGLECS